MSALKRLATKTAKRGGDLRVLKMCRQPCIICMAMSRCFRTKLHLRVNLVLPGFDESQTRIQPLCRIGVDYLQVQHCASRLAVLDQSANQLAPNSLPAMFGQ